MLTRHLTGWGRGGGLKFLLTLSTSIPLPTPLTPPGLELLLGELNFDIAETPLCTGRLPTPSL